MKRDLDEYLRRGQEVLFRQLECIEAKQRGDLTLPWEPLSHEMMQELEACLSHALRCKTLEVKVLSNMHRWPVAAVQMWQMRAQEMEEKELARANGNNGHGN
jgi:hypothetical protein